MSTYEVLLFLHILGAFLIVAGAGASTAAGILMSRSTSTGLIATVSRLQHITETAVTIPGALMVIVFGTWLVNEAGYDYDEPWLMIAYALWVIAVILGVGVLGPFARRVHKQATDLRSRGVEESDELRAAAAAPMGPVVGMLLNLIIVVFLYLMVVKPGA